MNTPRLQRLMLSLLILGLVTITGCLGTSVDDAKVKSAITAEVEVFRVAVERYNVEAMLKFLDKDNFKLTISEGISLSYDKDYVTLKSELEEDEKKQLRWRQPPPEGHSYVLTMNLGTITYTNIKANGAIGAVPFTILEESAEIEQVETDQGTIVVVMAKLQDQWLCQEMTINFETRSGQILARGQQGHLITAIDRGFGFSNGKFRN